MTEHPPRRNNIFLDEQHSPSAARVFCFGWLVFGGFLLWFRSDTAAIVPWQVTAMALIVWTAGPRIAQYLAPQISAAAKASSEALAAIKARRDTDKGIEATP